MKRILFVRTDKIGDFVTKWAALCMLKKYLLNASIEVFVSPVIASLARVFWSSTTGQLQGDRMSD
ncbi:hypothetical protein AB4238_02725 [Shewanella sp. 10N.286.45.A1]|uniref:hypothetical protein n=1 Tax=Shewanella sp. 10N.286.45.A1 TaxID=3229694 RepID=UPI0035512D08